jgi:hypothetical protein
VAPPQARPGALAPRRDWQCRVRCGRNPVGGRAHPRARPTRWREVVDDLDPQGAVPDPSPQLVSAPLGHCLLYLPFPRSGSLRSDFVLCIDPPGQWEQVSLGVRTRIGCGRSD